MTEGREAQPAAWYALRIRSRYDFNVRDQLRAAGVPAYCPTFDELTAWSDRKTVTTRPLFAGYIFARFCLGDAPAILQTRGVVQILGTGIAEYSTISDDVIADLQRVVDSRVTAAAGAYVAGDAVTIARGPFAGITGVVIRVAGATTLSIPVAILGRSVNVQISSEDVEASAS